MQLSNLTLTRIAELICGADGMGGQFEWKAFPYRSSYFLTRFFHDIDLDYKHDGGTRVVWVEETLKDINRQYSSDPRLPSDAMVSVLTHLIDPLHFEKEGCDHTVALDDLNRVLGREALGISFVDQQSCLSHKPTGVKAGPKPQTRPLSPAEQQRRDDLLSYLTDANEDEFTEHVVVPLFQFLGFSRVTMKGHRDKSLEYGKDLWMKFVIPTDHVLYFGAQVKIGRIHAAAREPTENISSILSQLKMVFGYPVFDPATNSKHLVDHAYLISSGHITEQARQLISDDLSNSMKRQILFIDQADILRMWAMSSLPLPVEEESLLFSSEDEIPF